MSSILAELATLGTNEATTFLAPLYDKGDSELVDQPDIWNGLASNPDRAFAVNALVAELANPERTIGRNFLRGLALIELARRHPSRHQRPTTSIAR